jgi:hypothetical protein
MEREFGLCKSGKDKTCYPFSKHRIDEAVKRFISSGRMVLMSVELA